MKTMTVNTPGINALAFSARSLTPNRWFQGSRLSAVRSPGMLLGDAGGFGYTLTSHCGSAPGAR